MQCDSKATFTNHCSTRQYDTMDLAYIEFSQNCISKVKFIVSLTIYGFKSQHFSKICSLSFAKNLLKGNNISINAAQHICNACMIVAALVARDVVRNYKYAAWLTCPQGPQLGQGMISWLRLFRSFKASCVWNMGCLSSCAPLQRERSAHCAIAGGRARDCSAS